MSNPRRPLIAGNWKLHKTVGEARGLAKDLKAGLAAKTEAEVVVAPVFTALSAVAEVLEGSAIRLSAQNVYWEAQGAFTGEVSAPLLRDVGCRYCIIGHSERRALFGDDDASVHRRLAALVEHGIRPILCVGETLAQREEGITTDVVLAQLGGGLGDHAPDDPEGLVVAYEPVWAIGTGRTASPGDAQEVHAAIRTFLRERLPGGAEGIRILYGGSVKPGNAPELLRQPDIDGALVGGASLTAESFLPIIAAAA